MARLPPPEEVAGPYLQQYDVYYKKLDPDGKNEIGAMEAAGFLKKSGLPDETLGKIWDMSDPEGKGSLDRAGLFVACKMVALVQSDQPLTVDNARVACPAPNFGEETAPGAPTAKVAPKKGGSVHFLVKPEEKRKYDALFDQLQPQEDKLAGDKVRQVMIGSKLPMPVLGQVWDLSDVDKDGFLDRYEFTVAMHLVYRALQGDKLPAELPAELSPEMVPKPLSAIPNLNGAPKPSVSQTAPTVEAVPWVVNAGEKLRYNALFKQTDTDRDGFVSGIEIKNVFLQTGLPQNILAHIWNLCDVHQEGKLNPEQFALAMWLIQRKQSGKDPPAALTPDMMPPTLRPKGQDSGKGGVYNNPELEMMAKEIQSLLSEKLTLEKEIQETDYNSGVKNTELNSLQGEFDTLSSTLKQLTNQKDVAQKRLDDLDTQKTSLDVDLQKLLMRIEEENLKIEKLRKQAEDQEATLVAQEEEVHGKQRELEALKDEEKRLLGEIKKSEKEIKKLELDLESASEINSEMTEQTSTLEEASEHMMQAMSQFKAYEETDADSSTVTDVYLEPLNLNLTQPDFSRLEKPAKPPVPKPPQMNGSMSDSDPFGAGMGGSAMTNSGGPPAAGWSENDAFAAFDQSPFVENNQTDDEPPPLQPRPDAGESPTPALPPKSSSAPPRRPPPPKRPPPPGGAAAAPGRPPPPGVSDETPFGAPAAETNSGGGGFADFANFDSFDAQFTSKSGWASSEDSAFGSADPTPTHTKKYSRSTLEFNEDPFKNANHRYGDPFDLAGADPFQESTEDPFTAPVTAAFGGPTTSTSTDFYSNAPFDPFNDPFAPVASSAAASDVKASKVSDSLNDSFDPFSLKNLAKSSTSHEVDPFGSDPFTPNADPFSAVPLKSSRSKARDDSSAFSAASVVPPPNRSLQKSETVANVPRANKASSSLQRQWSGSDPFGPSAAIPRTKAKAGHGLTDFLTGSPAKEGKDKKKKGFLTPLRSKNKGEKAAAAVANTSTVANTDDFQMKRAAEASRRVEEDRLRRLKLQEEQDLAYAIALSKAEAASLKQ